MIQNLLHDSYRQIEGQEKMIQQLLKNLQDKDKQLETYINSMGRAVRIQLLSGDVTVIAYL